MKISIKDCIDIHDTLKGLLQQPLEWDLQWDLSELHDQVEEIVKKTSNRVHKVVVEKYGADPATLQLTGEKALEYKKEEEMMLSKEVEINVPEFKRSQFANIKSRYICPAFRRMIK